ncbi:hypothetical protein HQ585_09750 [candidate division KSB1 bacterium]|nr:hypothetical protein [candidate division KSB1 bacterium]
MVDINLFDDDESEEKDAFDDGFGAESLDNHDDLNADNLGGDLSLDDDLSSDDAGFGEDSLLDGDDTIPEFEESIESDEMDDYAFEDTGKKKSIPWIWIILGVVVIAVVVYLYVIVPSQGPKPVKVQKSKRPVSAQTASGTKIQADQGAQNKTEQPGSTSAIPVTSVAGKTGNPVIAARAVFEDLSKKGSLGVVILSGNQYLVQYVSKTPGQGDVIGKNIQALIGASSYEVSPEDVQGSGGQAQYSGVISCVMPAPVKQQLAPDQNPYQTIDQFNQRVSELVKQSGLELKSTEKISGSRGSDGKQPSGHMIVEGGKVQALNFLNALNALQGNWSLSRLQLNPLNNMDYSAEKVRIGISFIVQIG